VQLRTAAEGKPRGDNVIKDPAADLCPRALPHSSDMLHVTERRAREYMERPEAVAREDEAADSSDVSDACYRGMEVARGAKLREYSASRSARKKSPQ